MDKKYAINLLGGTPRQAARAVGISDEAVCQWPDPLTERIEARVMFAQNKLKPSDKRAFIALAEQKKAESAAERTARLIAKRTDGINIPPQSDSDRRASFSKAAI